MYITVQETSLFIEDQGPVSALPIILLHGFPLDHRMWSHQIETLTASSYRVITPDLLGMGRSELPSSNISLDRYADDILAMMDQLQIPRAVLGGFSMGGYVAFALLRKAPERFSALILANTRPEADSPEGRQNRMKMAASLYEKGSSAAKDAMLPKLLTEHTRAESPGLVSELEQVMTAMEPEGLVHASLAMAFRPDASDLLTSIQVPTLVIAGEQDPITTPEIMKSMADQIPASQFHVIPEASHLTPQEKPDAFNAVLLGFLNSIKP
ncbi:alpha/beta fold hydrolase [Paenibacillus hexagrammi]|uniref:Alpha/beta hydrolase n=1 Tax=Paenibacillus hexagrammi TaxID=2908839 RepID=A0ABY3SF57_9BACL|nr:alpha/beta hydrolase [Paenibacillus sp. YPD9-1]UJF32432.1 alpha/beta hydrolase [Paenibacillus sp. YPD9-1]